MYAVEAEAGTAPETLEAESRESCSVVERLVQHLEPGSSRRRENQYVLLRRMLLYQQAMDGKLRRQTWKCNGISYNTYRQYICSMKQNLDDSGRWTSSYGRASFESNGILSKGPNSSVSRQPSFSSLPSESDQLAAPSQPGYSFVGMHSVFDQCKASVNIVRFGHLSSCLLAYGASDGTLNICSLETSARILHRLKGHSKEITDFDWSLNNQYLCSSSLDKSVRVWDVSEGHCLRVIYDKAHQLCIRFHPVNNNYLIVGTGNDQLKVINFSTGRHVHKLDLESSITAMDMDHSGRVLFAGDSKGCIHTITVDSHAGKLSHAHRNKMGLSHKSTTTTVQFRIFSRLAGGPVLLASNQDGSLRFFSVALEVKGYLTLRCSLHLPPHARNIRASFCPLLSLEKGEFIVSGNEDKNVYFYDFTRPKHPCVNKLQGHGAPVVGVSWNYGENLLASSDCEGLVIVWKRANSAML